MSLTLRRPRGASEDAVVAVDATSGNGVRIFVTGVSATGGTPPNTAEVDMVTLAYFEPWKQP